MDDIKDGNWATSSTSLWEIFRRMSKVPRISRSSVFVWLGKDIASAPQSAKAVNLVKELYKCWKPCLYGSYPKAAVLKSIASLDFVKPRVERQFRASKRYSPSHGPHECGSSKKLRQLLSRSLYSLDICQLCGGSWRILYPCLAVEYLSHTISRRSRR